LNKAKLKWNKCTDVTSYLKWYIKNNNCNFILKILTVWWLFFGAIKTHSQPYFIRSRSSWTASHEVMYQKIPRKLYFWWNFLRNHTKKKMKVLILTYWIKIFNASSTWKYKKVRKTWQEVNLSFCLEIFFFKNRIFFNNKHMGKSFYFRNCQIFYIKRLHVVGHHVSFLICNLFFPSENNA
jgi:hypothetical protein